MTRPSVLWLAVVLLVSGYTSADEVEFPSGVRLTPVDESTLSAAVAAQVEDPLNTGSPLFRVSTPLDDNTQLSRSFLTRSFRYPGSDVDYYRAHPALFSCLQQVYDHLINTVGKELQMISGYMTADELGGSPSPFQLYARTGCGAVLDINQASTTDDDVQDIAEAVMTYCPAIFALELRDIGVVAQGDRLHVYMAAPDVLAPHYSSVGYSTHNTADFAEWCQQKIDSSLLPYKLPECSYYDGLDANDVFPEGLTMDEAVGGLDEAITRDSGDFNRLLQFPGSDLLIEDSESGSSWCGSAGNPCAACGSGVVGQAAQSRCSDRLMSPRLYNVIKSVHALLNVLLNPVKLKIVEAWDEAHSAAPSGDTAADSVHREGRAAVLQLSTDNTPANIRTLTQYALCSGADYVKNDGDRVTIAVKKQAGLDENEVQFVMNAMLEVSPPSSVAADFVLPDTSIPAEYPLMDADNQEDVLLGEESTVGEFKSPSTRYFRLHSAIVECFDKVQQYDAKWAPDSTVEIDIVRGYLTEAELTAVFNPRYDKRRRGHVHGTAMHLKYAEALHGGNFSVADGTEYSAYRLASAIILNCAPLFSEQAGMEMGLGLYSDGVYVDLRDNFLVWVTDPDMLPLGESRATIRQKYLWAVDYRMFNPDDPTTACSPGTPPLPQSYTYDYQHSGYVHARRKKRQAGQSDGNDCTPQTGTEHCTVTETFRNNEISHIWAEIKRKHLFRHEDDVKAALDGCFGTCGTCTKGEFWEEKVEHCNNLLHWMPFELMNEAADVSNLYYRGNRNMKNYACHGERHCVDKAPLFAILAPSVETLYRPDPSRSVEGELYDALENPSPVPEVAYEIYGMHANGTVSVWVEDAAELEYLRVSLKPIMVYNKAVTKVNIYVLPNAENESPDEVKAEVSNQLNSMIKDWTTSICPTLARYATPPVAFKDIHAGIARRDIHVDRDFSEELAYKRRHFELEWMAKTLR